MIDFINVKMERCLPDFEQSSMVIATNCDSRMLIW